MIAGLDHIARTTIDIDADARWLQRQGYRLRFLERDVENPPIKADLLGTWQATHALAFLERPGAPSVELTDHGGSTGRTGMLVASDQPSHPWPGSPRPSGPGHLPQQAVDPGAPGPGAVHPAPEQAAGIPGPVPLGFEVATHDATASRGFWNALGFKDAGGQLVLSAPLGPGVVLRLTPVPGPVHRRLDDEGFPTLALLSTGADAERERLAAAGYEVTDVATLRLDRLDKHVFFVRGPGGEVVEVVAIRR